MDTTCIANILVSLDGAGFRDRMWVEGLCRLTNIRVLQPRHLPVVLSIAPKGTASGRRIVSRRFIMRIWAIRAVRLCGEQSGVWKMPTWILRSLRSQSCGAVINSDLKIRRPMSMGPEAVRSWKFLPGVNTKLGTASSIYNRPALANRFRWSS